MKTYKKILLVVSMFLVGTVALAKSSPEGQPFQAIRDAINNLQEQINNIQLIPGPQGEQGLQGEEGPMGPTGPQGPQGITGAGDIKFIYYGYPETAYFILKNDGKEYRWNQFSTEWVWESAYDVPISTDNIIQWQRDLFLDKDGNVWTHYNGWHII